MLSRNQRKERIPKQRTILERSGGLRGLKMTIGLEYLEAIGKYNGRSSSGI